MKAQSADFHVFHKTGGNRPSAYGNWHRFSALGPELPPRRVAIGAVFYQNSTVTDDKSPCLSAFSGCGARKNAPLQSLQPPPPYAPEAIAPPFESGICKEILLVSISPLCRWPSRAERPYPRSCPALGHKKARAFLPWPNPLVRRFIHNAPMQAHAPGRV